MDSRAPEASSPSVAFRSRATCLSVDSWAPRGDPSHCGLPGPWGDLSLCGLPVPGDPSLYGLLNPGRPLPLWAPGSLERPRQRLSLSSPLQMAEAGFIHCPTENEPDLAQCFFCFKELEGWEPDDDPM